MSKKIKSIKTKNAKSTTASVATNATPNFSINSKREIIPISTTSKGLYSMGRTNCFTMKKLDEFITNSIEARRDDKTVPIIRVVADYSTTFKLWELAVVDYNTCGMTKKELFSNYFCVGGESGEGEGHIAGFGSTAIFTLTRGAHPFFVASQSHLSNDAYCVNGGLQDDPVTHQAYTYIEPCKMEDFLPESLKNKKYGTPNTIVRVYVDEETIRDMLPNRKGYNRETMPIDPQTIRLAFAQHISVVYREKICGPNPMAYIYVQDLEFRKTSSRLDLSLEDDKTKWTRPIKAFDMDAAIAATSAQKANYSGTVVCGNDSVKYIYKFGTVDHNYIDHFGFMGVAPLYGYWDGSMNNSGFDVIAHGQSIASNLIEEITGRKRHPSMNHLIGELIILNAPKDKFRVTADKSSLDKSDKTWSLIISDIKANSILPACKTDAGTLRDMYAMYAKRCSSCGLRFVRNYSVGSSTGTKAPAIIEVVLPDNSIGYYLLMCKANETKSGPSLRNAMPLISSMLMMESNGKRVLGAYFVADRFSNGFVQDVNRLVEPINRNRTDRFEIRVCDTNTPLVLAVPAVSAQAAPVNINVGITIKKTR